MPPTDTRMPRSPANRDHRITRADPVGRIAPPDHARRHALGALAALGGITALPGASRAQTGVAGGYPSRAVRIIIPFSAGGTTDILAREMAARFADRWKVPVVPENKAGAGGNLGTAQAAQAVPDGHTLLCASVGPIAVSPSLVPRLPYNPLTDLVPIVLIADVCNVLVVHPGVPAQTVEEFIALMRRQPDAMNYGSTGIGTAAHLTGALFGLRTGTRPQHVPYRGAEALRDLVGGRIQFMFATGPSVIGLIKAGTVRALAVTGDARSRALPEVPTLQEKKLASFDSGSWFGFFGPRGTPAVAIESVNSLVNEALRDPAVQARMVANGADPVGGTPERFAAHVRAEIDKWRAVIRETGIQPE
jgi:tripartite-type tricarboxylate transporter receptor subunit TctC